jgi:cytochrome o ubiquinol oxidase subunit 1
VLWAAVGMVFSVIGVVCQFTQLFVSIRDREQNRDLTGDPWDGRSLEWSISSPPPAFNYAVLPQVDGEEPYWTVKQRAREQQTWRDEPEYEAIEMPRNSPTGFICAFFATLIGFALIWHIWWMAILGGVGAYATFVIFAWRDLREYEIPAAEVARIDRVNRSARQQALAGYTGPRL